MAEVTGLRNNALPYPIYGAPWGVVFPMLDADGDLVTGATTPDAERSLNGDTFADCTNESVEIATNSGMYYLLLTAAEMTADVVAVIAKSATAGMKTTAMTFYPRKLVTIRSGTSASGGVSTSTIVLDGSASAVDDFYNGMVCIATIDSVVEARVISDYTGSTQTATVVPDWNTAPDNNDTFVIKLPEGVQINQANTTAWLGSVAATPTVAGVPEVDVTHWIGTAAATPTTAGVPEVDVTHWLGTAAATPTTAGVPEVDVTFWLGTAAQGASGRPQVDVELIEGGDATDALTAAVPTAAAIADAVWDEDATGHQTQGTFGQAIGDPAADANTIYGAVVTGAAGATIAADIIAVKAETADILADTAEIGAAGAGLTNINLPNQTMDIVGNITGNLSGSVGSVTGLTASDVGAIKAKTDNLPSDPADASVIAGRFDTLDTAVADLPTNAELTTALGTADDAVLAQVALVKAKTDSLTFTVAGKVDANIEYVNGTEVTGVGSEADPWGP